MAESFTHHTPLQPGQRVAVFPFDAASGATIGYYGTVVHADAASIRKSPNFPDAWRYRVSTIAGWMNVPGCDILPLEPAEGDFVRRNRWPELEICFDSQLESDNDELRGFCRIDGADVGCFRFRKGPQQLPTFRLSMRATNEWGTPWSVKYEVPSECRLDRAYVRQAIEKILGDETRPDTRVKPIA